MDGVLDLNGYNLTLTSLSGTGDVTNDDWSPATLTVNVPTSTTDTFDGLIEDGTGRLTFTLDGPGTFAFSQGAYSGDTIVSGGGTLQIGAPVAGDVQQSTADAELQAAGLLDPQALEAGDTVSGAIPFGEAAGNVEIDPTPPWTSTATTSRSTG